MAGEPFRIDSSQQMVMHARADGSECVVWKPDTVCPCGEYQVRWLPVRAPVPYWTMQAWICGDDVAAAP
jgi:hypothetical protein